MRSTLGTKGDSGRAAARSRALSCAALGVAALLAVGACSSTASRSASSGASGTVAAPVSAAVSTGGSPLPPAQLSLVAYSTPQAAYDQIIKAFQATPEGRNITFTESFGASGDQSRAVESGLAADVVAFSLAPDMTRLVKDGIVGADWKAGPYKGVVTDSVVVFVVRKGNPKHIQTWADLVRPGVQVITPNPFTSGGARWNVMAAYGANSNKGADDQAGLSYLDALFHNVPVQDSSARTQLQTFVGGKGDVMIDYENDAIFAQQHGQALDYIVPDQTILIENPVAVSTKSAHPEQAKAFLDFLFTPAAQRIFAQNGYRPVMSGVAPVSQF